LPAAAVRMLQARRNGASIVPGRPQRPSRRGRCCRLALCMLAALGGCEARPTPQGLSPQDPAVEAHRPLRLPADWEHADALLLSCDELVEHHPRAFIDLVAAARGSATLVGLVADTRRRRAARQLLLDAKLPPDSVRFLPVRTRTMWVRDYGPLTVRGRGGAALLIDMEYPSLQQMQSRSADDLVPVRLGRVLGLPVVSAPLRADGGNLLTNGEGLCVASTALLADNASRGYERPDVQRVLADCTGCRRVLFLEPLRGERTRHVDMFVCFLAVDRVVVARCDPALDAVNARRLDAAAAELTGLWTSRGPLKVHRVPMPPRWNGRWRTYTNVLFAGSKLLVPTYSHVKPSLQREALDVYRRLLPGRTVVGVNADTLAGTNGSLHCIALNVPASALEGLGEQDRSVAPLWGQSVISH
jgi:agmatine deiminase